MATDRVGTSGKAFDAWGWSFGIYGYNGVECSVTVIAALYAIALTAPRELPRTAPIPP